MARKFEKIQEAKPETRQNFKKSLISHILSLAIPKILENCAEKNSIEEKDVAEEIGWMIEGYKKSDMVARMLDIEGYEDWDVFRDEITDIVKSRAREAKKKREYSAPERNAEMTEAESAVSENSPLPRSENLKQKNLF